MVMMALVIRKVTGAQTIQVRVLFCVLQKDIQNLDSRFLSHKNTTKYKWKMKYFQPSNIQVGDFKKFLAALFVLFLFLAYIF